MEKQTPTAKCQNFECGKAASFMCPTCTKLALSPSFFCSQECFKAFWPIHKTFHKKADEREEKKSKFAYTGPLRPGKISARRQVPAHIKLPDYALTGVPQEEL
jgi:methionyl aminopeptidase